MDYVLAQVLYLCLHFADYEQTLAITRHPDRYYENNIILGKHPHKDKVTAYFVGTAIAHTAITFTLPDEYKKYWLASTISLEAVVVHDNYKAGLTIGF